MMKPASLLLRSFSALVAMILLILISACKFNIDTGQCLSANGGCVAETTLPVSTVSRPINDTGITACGDYAYGDAVVTHNNNVDCAAVGATQTVAGVETANGNNTVPAGQDAVYGRDAQAAAGTLVKTGAGHAGFDFTKLDANGDDLDASALSWACVRDNVTGLVWENKTNDGGLHDRDNTYTWYSTDANNNGGNAGTGNGGVNTQQFAADVNATTLCGRNNWRLPHKEELSGIVARDRYTPNPTIDSNFFANTLASHIYWTASPAYNSGNNSTLAWAVYFSYGYEGLLSKNTARSVRLVSGDVLHAGETLSGCQASIYASKVDAIYNDHGDGTVTDTQTGLMWAKCPLGLSDAACATGTATTANWKQHKPPMMLNFWDITTGVCLQQRNYAHWQNLPVQVLRSTARCSRIQVAPITGRHRRMPILDTPPGSSISALASRSTTVKVVAIACVSSVADCSSSQHPAMPVLVGRLCLRQLSYAT